MSQQSSEVLCAETCEYVNSLLSAPIIFPMLKNYLPPNKS